MNRNWWENQVHGLWLVAAVLCSACDPEPQVTPRAMAATVSIPIATSTASSAAPSEPWLQKTLRTADPRLAGWLKHAEALRLQIVLTIVQPGQTPAQKPAPWKQHAFRADAEYFYPASAIKPLIAVEALRQASARAGEDIPLRSEIIRCRIGRPGCEPPREDADPSKKHQKQKKPKHKELRLGKEIHKLLAYSDNDAFNRLYDFIGHRALNEAMPPLTFDSVRFHHKMNTPPERSLHTPQVLLRPPGKPAIVFKERRSDFQLPATKATGLRIGQGYREGRKQIDQPLDFGHKNAASLHDLQRLLIALVFPQHPKAVDLNLSEAQRQHLIQAMTTRLTSRRSMAHSPFAPGVLDADPDHLPARRLRYIGKSGRAYGFHLDNAYIEDRQTKRGFFLTAVVYANPNGILNDDDYEYKSLSKPLLAAIGKALTRAILLQPPSEPR